MTAPTQWGWSNVSGLGRVRTEDLVARIRRFRGRKTIAEIVTELGMRQGRYSWLRIRSLCQRYEIVTADPDDVDYWRSTIAADRRLAHAEKQARKAEQERLLKEAAVLCARAALQAEIAAARSEMATAPLYDPVDLR